MKNAAVECYSDSKLKNEKLKLFRLGLSLTCNIPILEQPSTSLKLLAENVINGGGSFFDCGKPSSMLQRMVNKLCYFLCKLYSYKNKYAERSEAKSFLIYFIIVIPTPKRFLIRFDHYVLTEN